MADIIVPGVVGAGSEIYDISASVGITARMIKSFTSVYVRSATSGNTTITASPQIEAGKNAQRIIIWGTDNTRTVTLTNNSNLYLYNSTVTLKANTALLIEFSAIESKWKQIHLLNEVESIIETALEGIGLGTDTVVQFGGIKTDTTFVDQTDSNKKLKFDLTQIRTSTTKNIKFPDEDIDLNRLPPILNDTNNFLDFYS